MESFDECLRSYGDQNVIDIKYEPFTADILYRIKGKIVFFTKLLELCHIEYLCHRSCEMIGTGLHTLTAPPELVFLSTKTPETGKLAGVSTAWYDGKVPTSFL